MLELFGWVALIFSGALFIAQVISVFDFELAQKLGIQEKADRAAAILQRAERYTAFWDLFTLGWMPIAATLIILDHPYWPVCALIAGAIYFDAAGREGAKILCFKHEGLAVGNAWQSRLFFASYILMLLLGLVMLSVALASLNSTFSITWID